MDIRRKAKKIFLFALFYHLPMPVLFQVQLSGVLIVLSWNLYF